MILFLPVACYPVKPNKDHSNDLGAVKSVSIFTYELV